MTNEYKLDDKSDMDAFAKMFENLDETIRRKVITKSVRAGATIVKKDAQRRAKSLDDSHTRNDISKNIAIKFSSSKARKYGDFTMRVGVLGGSRSRFVNDQNPGKDTFYWRFLEHGTKKLTAKPFLLPSLENNITAVLSKIVTTFQNELNKIATK